MKPEKETNWITWINHLAISLVSLLALGAFVLSYNALYEVAKSHGIPGSLAYIWPLLIDGAIVVFSISVVRASLLREAAYWPWALVIVFTAGTVFFNILHFVPINRPLLVSITIAIIAPVGLVLAFETVMGMLKSNVARRELVQSIAQIEAETKEKRAELDRLQHERLAEIEAMGQRLQLEKDSQLSQLDKWIEEARLTLANYQEQLEPMERTIQTYQQDIEAKKEELKALGIDQAKIFVPANLDISQRRELVNRMSQEGMTIEAIAGALGCSVGTVKNDKAANKQIVSPVEIPGTIARNGNGHAGKG